METVSAADQENKKKPPRAGSVPPRATTPVNAPHSYVPGAKTGVVTPAVRPGSSNASHSLPNKRQRLGESTSGGQIGKANTPSFGQRAPLGANRGGNIAVSGNGRTTSPSKIPGKTPTAAGGSSLPRPVHIAMPVPKVGTQHHALGHGRVPSAAAGGYSAGYRSTSSSVASNGSGGGYGRYASSGSGSGNAYLAVGAKKASRARRESFKPRPSVDGPGADLKRSGAGGAGRWAGFPGCVKEEEEGY